MDIKGISKFSISEGKTVLIELYGSNVEPALPFLYGTVLTVLLQMHSIFPLHSSAVVSNKGINLFCAQSGTGKSTLALTLHHLGFPLFTDDKCIIEWDNMLKKYVSEPHIRAVRLWRDAIDELDDHVDLVDGMPVLSKKDKFQFNLNNLMYKKPQIVNQIFVIRKSKKFKEITIRPLNTKQGVMAVKNNVHKYKLISGELTKKRYLRFSSNVARLVPIYFVQRPENMSIVDFADFMKRRLE